MAARAMNSFALFYDEESDDILEVWDNVAKKKVEEAKRAREQAKREEAERKDVARMLAEWNRIRAETERQSQQQDESGEISPQRVSPQRYGNGKGGHGYDRGGRNGRFRNGNGFSSSRGGCFGGRGQANGFKNEAQVVELEKNPQNENTEEKDWQNVTKKNGHENNGKSAPVLVNANNGIVVESTELKEDAKDAATDTSGVVVEVVKETGERKKAPSKEEKEKSNAKTKQERIEKEKEARRKGRLEENKLEAKQMTLKQYEKIVLAEKRKALEDKANKVEERKLTIDQSFENMSLIEKKEEEKPETEKSNKLKKKNSKVQKVSIDEFLKQQAEKAKLSENKSAEGVEQKQPSKNGSKLNNGRGSGRRGKGRGRGVGSLPRQGTKTHSKNGEDNGFKNGSNRVGYQRVATNDFENKSNRGGHQRVATNSFENRNNRGGYQKGAPNSFENRSNHGGYQRAASNDFKNRSNRGGCQREASNGPVARNDDQSNGFVPAPKTPPPIEDAEQFPHLTKAVKA